MVKMILGDQYRILPLFLYQILDPSHHSMDDVIDILEDPTPVYLHDLDLFDNIYVAKEIVMTTEYPDLGFFYDIYA